jgi:hypothetical protein
MSATPNLDRMRLAAKREANEAYDARDVVGMLEAETRADMIDAERTLAGYAQRLAKRLTTLAERLESDAGDAAWINSAGEVQGSALDIDMLCARIATLRSVLQGVNSARRAAADKEGA